MATTTHKVRAHTLYQAGRSGKQILVAYVVSCEECGGVGPRFVPTDEGMIKAHALSNKHREESRVELN